MKSLPGSYRCNVSGIRKQALVLAGMVLSLLLPALAQAQYCTATANWPAGRNVSTAVPATVNPRPGDAAGTTYYTLSATLPGFTYARCGRSQDYILVGLWDGVDADTGYWPSAVRGLGWRVTRNGTVVTAPTTRNIGPGNIATTSTTWTMTLVRTNQALESGTVIPPYIQGRFETGANTVGIYWNWSFTGSSRVTIPTCSVAGTAINIGRRLTSDMRTVGSYTTTSGTSNVTLTCSNSPRVDMRLTTVPLTSTPNVLPLTGQATGRAAGIGVQLMNGTSVVAYNATTRVSAAAASTLNISLGARYYRTGNMTPGRADSSAVLQFTYP